MTTMTTMKTTTPRRSIKVPKKELTIWRVEFKEYGAKAAAERATGVEVQTIRNIVNKGRGLIANVEKLRLYIKSIQDAEIEIKNLVYSSNTAA